MIMRTIFETIGGVSLIVLGVLFMAYLGTNPTELATDAIFVGAGVLVIKRAFQNRVRAISRPQTKPRTKRNQR